MCVSNVVCFELRRTHGRREEDDIAVRLRQLRELRALEVRLGCPGAVCQCNPSVSMSLFPHSTWERSGEDGNAQWLATMSAGLDATFAGLYTNICTLFGFGPKFEICVSVDAGIDASPVGALPVDVVPTVVVVTGTVVVGAGAEPGWH